MTGSECLLLLISTVSFSERSGIMEALRQYVISVVAAAMLCGIVVSCSPMEAASRWES